jgi:hypothetical protein
MTKFFNYLREGPQDIEDIGEEIEEIEISLKKNKYPKFLSIMRKYIENFDRVEGMTTKDHVKTLPYREAMELFREIQKRFKK